MRHHIKFFTGLFFAASIISCVNEDNNKFVPGDLAASAKTGGVEVKSSGTVDVDLGGSNEPNNVYIDLSTGKTTKVRRDRWELGFYNGRENRVFLNSSLCVTAAKTEFTDIDKVTKYSKFKTPMNLYSSGVFRTLLPTIFKAREVTVTTVEELTKGLPLAYGMYGGGVKYNISFTDNKEGTLEGTALGKIAADPSQAKVCIVSLGYKIPTSSPRKGRIDTKGDQRGFYKIKVFMQGGQYVMQYAKLDETTHKEFKITKDNSHNLSFFSFEKGTTVTAAPPKTKFDINFAGVFGFYTYMKSPLDRKYYWAGVTYSDYALTNNLGGTEVYGIFTQELDKASNTYVPTNEPAYETFTRADIDESKFKDSDNDRTVIDSHWRSVFPRKRLIPGVYYIIKDSDGNIYKLKFTRFLSESGERGYPKFT